MNRSAISVAANGQTDAPNLPTMICMHARRQPEALSLSIGSMEMTYAELDARSSRLARHLQSLGAAPEVLVAICLERSLDFVVAALAILKSGAAYLPMDPAHPAERLRFILQDADAPLLITQGKFTQNFAGTKTRVLDLAAEKSSIAAQSSESPEITADPDRLAYVIYTSGSTGQPKGVEITHGNLENLIAWHLRAFGLDASSRTTFQAGVGFDAAVWEIWPTLAVGASLHLPDDETRVSAEALRDWLVVRQISISFVSTALAEQLIALPWPAETALRFLLTGADTLHRFPPAGLPFALVNNYGPTEGTVVATSGVILPNGVGLPTIGTPIDGVEIHLRDERRREVPNGATGEIFLGGAGIARGYRNRPELTAERFVDGGRFYRTGDLARRRPNGELEFIGRVDDQVKIRGHRIELGEINALLNQQPTVRASVVVAREDSPNEKRLVAYLVPANGARDESPLRHALRQKLPDYMEPSAFVWLDALPLNANGKIDRAALPAPTNEGENFVAPRTPIEERLAEIIAEVLKLPRVSVHDDFFQLGAHSLLGAQVIARVRGVFGTELKLLDVFDSPTVAELSVKIEEALTRQLSAMSEAEVEAALATFDGK